MSIFFFNFITFFNGINARTQKSPRWDAAFCDILSTSKIQNFCGCTAGFVWGLVGNPEDRFSHDQAHTIG